MKRLGPELKMPDLKALRARLGGAKGPGGGAKAPDFLVDVYWDLRDRRLLPLVAFVLVAIAAVPFLLGADAEEPALPAAVQASKAQLQEEIADASDLVVVESKPGLRDYRRRLRGRTPTDPFAQQYTSVPQSSLLQTTDGDRDGSAEVEVEVGGGGEGEGIEVEVTESPGGSEGGGSPGGSGGGEDGDARKQGGKGKGKSKGKAPRLLEFVIDVQVSRSEETADGGRKMSEPLLRRRVRALSQLPGKKAPVVTTMGINLRTAKVLFLVSDQAHSLDGEFRCLARTPAGLCELVEVEPGFPFDVIHGPNKVRYRFKVTKIGAVWAGRVGDERYRRAALEGEPGSGFAGRLGGARVAR